MVLVVSDVGAGSVGNGVEAGIGDGAPPLHQLGGEALSSQIC